MIWTVHQAYTCEVMICVSPCYDPRKWMDLRFRESIDFFLALHLSLAGNSGRLTWVRLQQPQEQRYPFLSVRAVFSCVHTKVRLPMLGICNVRRDVKVSDFTRALYGHRKRVYIKSWLWENSLAVPGNRTCLSGVPVRRFTNWAPYC